MSHRDAIDAAMQTDAALSKIFAEELGTAANPDGRIIRAYERARIGLAGAAGDTAATAVVMRALEEEVTAALRDALSTAVELGVTQANVTLGSFGLPATMTVPELQIDTASVLRQLLNIVEQQSLAATSGLLDTAELIGDGARVGLVSHGAMTSEASRWIGTVASTATEMAQTKAAPAVEWARQAVAAIDENTTECCLDAHGQIVGIEEPFKTPFPPAFASEQLKPPFHRWCRTVLVMVPVELAEDDLTEAMRLAARLEREARERPGYTPPEVANAFTRVAGYE